MRKCVIAIIYMCLFASIGNSQELKISTGISLSSLNFKNASFLSKNIKYPFVSIGMNYLDHKYWCLSSEIGFIENGGMEKDITVVPNEGQILKKDIKEHWPCLQLNTTFRAKVPVKNNYFLLGAGPALGFVLGDVNIDNSWGDKLNRCNLGLKTEVGYNIKLREHFNLAFLYSYIFPITPFGKDGNNQDFSSRISTFSLSLGYRL